MKVSYYTKLSGTSFHQADVFKVKPKSTPLRCIARENNEYDPFAVEVQACIDGDWVQIGWIQKGKNEAIHKYLLAGGEVRIVCTDVTGQEKDTLGVNVGIEYGSDDSVSVEKLPEQAVFIGDEPKIYWDEENHKAFSLDGKELYSGSKIEKYPFPEFDPTYPAKALAKKTGVIMEDIKAMWEWNGDIASRYGTIIHEALEHYWLYHTPMQLLDEAKGRKCQPQNWMPQDIGVIVEKFLKHLGEWGVVKPEVRVKYKQYTGIVDLLEETPDGYNIHDYKITHELKELSYPCLDGKRIKYTLQQNCYRYIIEQVTGKKVLGMYLHQWDGESWSRHTIDRINDNIFEEELWKQKK